MVTFLSGLSDRLLALVVPQARAEAAACYWAYQCIRPYYYRRYCCNGYCGPLEYYGSC